MKKFLCLMCLMVFVLSAHAIPQVAYSPPGQEVVLNNQTTLSADATSVAVFDFVYNIVDLQVPVMLNTEVSSLSAQVVGDYSTPTRQGEVSETLACFMWPNSGQNAINHRNDFKYSVPIGAIYDYSFAHQRTGHI